MRYNLDLYDGEPPFPYILKDLDGSMERFRKYYFGLTPNERYKFFNEIVLPKELGEVLLIDGENDKAFVKPTVEDADLLFWEIVKHDIVIGFYYYHLPKIVEKTCEPKIKAALQALKTEAVFESISENAMLTALKGEIEERIQSFPLHNDPFGKLFEATHFFELDNIWKKQKDSID